MAKSATCDLSGFSVTVEKLLGDIPLSVRKNMGNCVAKSARYGARQLRQKYAKGGKHKWSDRYTQGFSSHTSGKADLAVGEVGNKREPGLVHLLEKGHLTPAGRRTNAYPHMAPAFEDMAEKFIAEAEKAFGEAIG